MDLRPRISSRLRGMRGVLRTFTPAESYWLVGIAATPADGIATGAIGTALMVVVIAWLLIGEPLWGRMSHRRFMAQLAAGVPRARERFYAMWSTMLWALAGVVLLIAALTPGIGLARIGFRWPDLRFDIGGTSSLVAGMVVGAIGGAVAAIIASRRQKPDSNSGGAAAVPAGEAVLAMLPRTPAER